MKMGGGGGGGGGGRQACSTPTRGVVLSLSPQLCPSGSPHTQAGLEQAVCPPATVSAHSKPVYHPGSTG